MATRVYKLYGTGSTTTSDLAHVDLKADGFIVAIDFGGITDAAANAEGFLAEISFSSSGQTNANDVIGPICQIGVKNDVGAVGQNNPRDHTTVSGIAIPIRQGERLYLNALQLTGANNFVLWAMVYVEE